jgi:hypothetical protein
LRAKRCRVHRTPPRVRDDHDTPLLWGGMRKVLDVIWGEWERKYFCKEGWTPELQNSPSGKSIDRAVPAITPSSVASSQM